jgi:hypothetical protein
MVLVAVLTSVVESVRAGRPVVVSAVLYVALTAVLAYLTPLVQSYGAGQLPADDDPWSHDTGDEGVCGMYGRCFERPDGEVEPVRDMSVDPVDHDPGYADHGR